MAGDAIGTFPLLIKEKVEAVQAAYKRAYGHGKTKNRDTESNLIL